MMQSVRERSQVGEARRTATQLARDLGLDEAMVGNVALVATELATNLLKHGGGGDIVMGDFADAEGSGLQMLALDQGPGMADVAACLDDGHSTSGSPGTGLGAIGRQSSRFAIYSRPQQGTVVMARFRSAAATAAPVRIGAVLQPCPGETASGDGWAFDAQRGLTLFMVDGSGHGAPAAHAAEVAVKAFHANAQRDCTEIIEATHRALAPTRGGAVAVARVDLGSGLVRFVGIGNISGTIVRAERSQHMVSHNGTAGHVAPRIREFTYATGETPLIVMHSDGISSRWDLSDYPGLLTSHPALAAGAIFRDWRRGRDDALVVAMRPAA